MADRSRRTVAREADMRRWTALAGALVLVAAGSVATVEAVPSTDPGWADDVVFASHDGQWDIWKSPVEGGPPVQVADTGGRDVMPEWSPDRSVIAFAGNGQGDYDIWAVAPDGANLRKLVDTPGQDLWPTWSRDGQYLAYMSDTGGVWHIYVLRVATGETQQVHSPSATSGLYPAWHPDGTALAFVGDTSTDTSSQLDVFIAPNPFETRYDGNAGQVTSTTWNETRPRISPNGLYVGWVDQGRDQLRVRDLVFGDMSGDRPVAPANVDFQWAPNGLHLVTAVQGDVFLAAASDQWYEEHSLEPFPDPPIATNMGNPIFSPDGTWLLANTFSGESDGNLYRIDLDGTVGTLIDGPESQAGFAQFRPRDASRPTTPVVTATAGPRRGEVTFTVLVPDDGGVPLNMTHYFSSNGVDTVVVPVASGPTIGVIGTFTESDLEDGEIRGHGLAVFNAVGGSPQGFASARAPYLPGAPADLQASVTQDGVRVSWQPPVDNGGVAPQHYRIYRSGRKGEFFLLATVPGDATSFTHAVDGKPEDYAVTAVNVVGEGNRAEVSVLNAR